MTTDYLLDGQSVVRTTDSNSNTVTYLTGPRGPEYERSGNAAPKWNLYDGLGSVVGTVDASGNILSKRKYDVYGAVRGLIGQSGTKHRFVGGLGHPSEDETGLIYMRARWMDPASGRFASEDDQNDGPNRYSYAADNPVMYVDHSGHFIGLVIGLAAGIGFALGLIIGYNAGLHRPTTRSDLLLTISNSFLGGIATGLGAAKWIIGEGVAIAAGPLVGAAIAIFFAFFALGVAFGMLEADISQAPGMDVPVIPASQE